MGSHCCCGTQPPKECVKPHLVFEYLQGKLRTMKESKIVSSTNRDPFDCPE